MRHLVRRRLTGFGRTARAGAVTGVLVLSTTGVAMAGGLPSGAQEAFVEIVQRVTPFEVAEVEDVATDDATETGTEVATDEGTEVATEVATNDVAEPATDEDTDAATENHGSEVSEFARTTELKGCEKGQAVAAVAGGKGRQNGECPTRDEDEDGEEAESAETPDADDSVDSDESVDDGDDSVDSEDADDSDDADDADDADDEAGDDADDDGHSGRPEGKGPKADKGRPDNRP